MSNATLTTPKAKYPPSATPAAEKRKTPTASLAPAPTQTQTAAFNSNNLPQVKRQATSDVQATQTQAQAPLLPPPPPQHPAPASASASTPTFVPASVLAATAPATATAADAVLQALCARLAVLSNVRGAPLSPSDERVALNPAVHSIGLGDGQLRIVYDKFGSSDKSLYRLLDPRDSRRQPFAFAVTCQPTYFSEVSDYGNFGAINPNTKVPIGPLAGEEAKSRYTVSLRKIKSPIDVPLEAFSGAVFRANLFAESESLFASLLRLCDEGMAMIWDDPTMFLAAKAANKTAAREIYFEAFDRIAADTTLTPAQRAAAEREEERKLFMRRAKKPTKTWTQRKVLPGAVPRKETLFDMRARVFESVDPKSKEAAAYLAAVAEAVAKNPRLLDMVEFRGNVFARSPATVARETCAQAHANAQASAKTNDAAANAANALAGAGGAQGLAAPQGHGGGGGAVAGNDNNATKKRGALFTKLHTCNAAGQDTTLPFTEVSARALFIDDFINGRFSLDPYDSGQNYGFTASTLHTASPVQVMVRTHKDAFHVPPPVHDMHGYGQDVLPPPIDAPIQLTTTQGDAAAQGKADVDANAASNQPPFQGDGGYAGDDDDDHGNDGGDDSTQK